MTSQRIAVVSEMARRASILIHDLHHGRSGAAMVKCPPLAATCYGGAATGATEEVSRAPISEHTREFIQSLFQPGPAVFGRCENTEPAK